MNITAIKPVTKFVVECSVGFVIGSVIKNNVTPVSKLTQAEMLVGSFVLGGLIGEKASEYTDKKIDELAAWWDSKKESTETE